MELKVTPSIKNVDTLKAPFFKDNKLLYSDSCPVSGQYKVGDIVISNTQTDDIIGWICIEAGNPGVWNTIENTSLSYPIEAPYVFENFTNIEADMAPNDDASSIVYKFQGKVPVEVSEDIVYISRIKINDNDELYIVGYSTGYIIGSDSETGSAHIFFDSVLSNFELGLEMIAALITNANISETDPSDVVFEKNNNVLMFAYPEEEENPNLLPIKMEIITISRDEFDQNLPESGDTNEIIDYINSLFEIKTLKINNEFFKTYKFVTQDMINDIGDANNLTTNNKTIVGAINELFQNVDSGKQLIADAIDDDTITKDSTFEAMSEAIKQLGTPDSVRLDIINSCNTIIDLL